MRQVSVFSAHDVKNRSRERTVIALFGCFNSMAMKSSRRAFLKAGSAAASLSVLDTYALPQAVAEPKQDAVKLRQFDYSQVELLDGPMREQFRTNHAFFLALDEDSLLKPF